MYLRNELKDQMKMTETSNRIPSYPLGHRHRNSSKARRNASANVYGASHYRVQHVHPLTQRSKNSMPSFSTLH
jgi:hypothetical protein